MTNATPTPQPTEPSDRSVVRVVWGTEYGADYFERHDHDAAWRAAGDADADPAERWFPVGDDGADPISWAAVLAIRGDTGVIELLIPERLDIDVPPPAVHRRGDLSAADTQPGRGTSMTDQTTARDPKSPLEWQEAVDTANLLLTIDAARQYGLVEGGPGVDVGRCEELLARGKALGYTPSPAEDVLQEARP